jgi:hypothetical protein
MSIAIAKTIHVLEEIVKVLPVGTNLAHYFNLYCVLHCVQNKNQQNNEPSCFLYRNLRLLKSSNPN